MRFIAFFIAISLSTLKQYFAFFLTIFGRVIVYCYHMYQVGDLRRRYQRRLRQRLIAAAGIVVVMLISYFFIFRNSSFLSGNNTPGIITSVEPVADSLTFQSALFDTAHLPENEVVISKKTPVSTFDPESNLNTNPDSYRENDKTIAKSPGTKQLAEKNAGDFYEVATIAHFYNAPDERSRSKTFINYWNNSSASLKAVDEKNGFVYVRFQNQLDQTTEGWLRKKDLKKVNMMYANNKE
jgi:hypothetical protein